MIFSELVSKWERLILPHFKPSTQSDVQSQLRVHLLPYFGSNEIQSITGETIQEFVSHLSRLSPCRTRAIIATLRSIWKHARAWGYVTTNPFEALMLPRLEPSSRRTFTLPEVQQIIAAAPKQHKLLYHLAAETGLRIGELLALKWEDIHDNRITVRRSLYRGRVGTPKSHAGYRTVTVSASLAAHLGAETGGSVRALDNFIFTSRAGTPFRASNFCARCFRPLLRRLGIQGSFHSFRHANATIMDELGTPMKVRQQRLGHSRASVTMDTYTHVSSQEEQHAADQIGAALESPLI
jgi:integrase